MTETFEKEIFAGDYVPEPQQGPAVLRLRPCTMYPR